ncbi:MAG: hypothetical protein V3V20_07225 [Algisphaera sp.]
MAPPFNLDLEAPANSPYDDVLPKAATLEDQIERYESHWSAVDFEKNNPKALTLRYSRRGPKGWWPIIPAALCISLAALLFFISPLGQALNILLAASLLSLAAVFGLIWRSHTAITLNQRGLKTAPFPPFTGPKTKVDLANLRRFKVEKAKSKKGKTYTVNAITRDGLILPLVDQIKLKDDAYLISTLLIDRVKRERNAG